MTPMSFSRWLDLSSKSFIAVALFAAAFGTIIILASLADRVVRFRSRTKDDRVIAGPGGRAQGADSTQNKLDW
jgi:Na+/alanine symporter